ncbi:MmcQ/YjbR family DNA-binding protein [Lactococcus petauri]|uniref:MmcQ/YjbR family DNA-binding protein n=1 Tax=Lactococcus petauri TaxID=1940789 RepID=UPI0013FD4898|nr:MmcQ/YjbR family DNA-binding protein [Lactococcus petauri]NHI76153.1 MmcQ/YjbR family DNA-binding protein [Lactococcus petauri]
MDKENWLSFCLALGPTFADTPFAKMEKGPATIVVKHLKNKKSFVYISEREGELVLAVKGLPSVNEELRESFVSIRPAWHMNKTHWNDIHFGGDVSEKQAKQMIENSYHLIKPKRE